MWGAPHCWIVVEDGIFSSPSWRSALYLLLPDGVHCSIAFRPASFARYCANVPGLLCLVIKWLCTFRTSSIVYKSSDVETFSCKLFNLVFSGRGVGGVIDGES